MECKKTYTINKNNSSLDADSLREIINYDEDTGQFCWRKKPQGVCMGQPIGHFNKLGYLQIRIKLKLYQAHRLAWLYHYGKWPVGVLDHVNMDRFDNRILNLRDCEQQQNCFNQRMHKNNVTGLKGVSPRRGGWRASIVVSRKQIHLGDFGCPTAAHFAYCAAAKKYHGKFARAA